MLQEINVENKMQDGTPMGGYAMAIGMQIRWQEGALGRGKDRQAPNGVFVETVIETAKQRLEHYQTSKFACGENAIAIKNLEEALAILDKRTKGRESRGVEGTHEL